MKFSALLRRALVACLFVFGSFSAIAQPGTSCSSSIALTPGTCLDSFATSDSVVWFSVVPGATSLRMTFLNHYGHYTGDSAFYDIALYASCTGSPIAISVPDPPAMRKLAANGLTVSSQYFIRVKKQNVDPAMLNICIEILDTQPCSCLPNGFNLSNSCDLVCNGGFENTMLCDSTWARLHYACPWYSLNGSADLLHANFCGTPAGLLSVPNNMPGVEPSYNGGSGYAGFIAFSVIDANVPFPDYREYVVQQLAAPLQVGEPYRIKFKASLSENSAWATTCIGAWLTVTPPVQPGQTAIITAAPQVVTTGVVTQTNGWLNFGGNFPDMIGNGEQYITIGNFCNDANSQVTPVVPLGNPGNMNRYAYYYLDSVSVEWVGPQVDVTASPTTVCSGDSVLLTGISFESSTYSLTWTGSGLLSNTGSPVIALPVNNSTGVQTFLYTGTFSLNGYGSPCLAHDTALVTVLPGPIVSAGNDTAICPGESANLQASFTGQASTYGWTDLSGNPLCINCSMLVVTPSSTTSYIFQAANSPNGCDDADTVTVFIHTPAPVSINEIPGAVTCDDPLFIFTASGGPFSSYQWNSNAQSASNNSLFFYAVDWTSDAVDGYVTLNVTDTNGCSASDSIVIPRCCCDSYYPTPGLQAINDNVDSLLVNYPGQLQIVGTTVILTSRNLCINGIFTVNRNFDLRGVKVFMGTDARIDVLPGFTFTLEGTGNTLADQTVVQACDRMWDGIYIDGVNSATLLDVKDGTVIEDAHTAIVSTNGGQFDVHGSVTAGPVKLNKNDTAIVVLPHTGLHPGRVVNTIISCDAPTQAGGSPGITSAGTVCIAPVLARSNAGITTERATLTIGDNTNILNRNIFERLNFGIIAKSSTTIVQNNIFRTMPANPGNSFSGVAIWAFADKTFTGNLKVGGLVPLDSNRFENCNIGIDAFGHVTFHCENNTFQCAASPLVGNFAIGVFGCPNTVCTIFNNRIWQWNTGIWMLENTNMVADVNANFINITPYSLLSPVITTAASNYGIRVENAVQLNMDLNIRLNRLSRCKIGVQIVNVLPSAPGNNPPRVRYNKIGFDFGAAYYPAATAHGIKVFNSPDVFIDMDTITRNYTNVTGGPLPAANIAANLVGIHVENSNNAVVSNNYLNRMGAGIWMQALCPASMITCNHLVMCWDGVFLNTTTIGDQYAGLPSDNRFSPNPAGPNSLNFDLNGAVAPAILWWYRPTLVWFIPTNNATGVTPNPSTGLTACGPVVPPISAPLRSAHWEEIVMDSLENVQDSSENRRMSHQKALQHFQAHPSELTLGVPDDITYQQFVIATQASSIGDFCNVLDLVQQDQISNAQAVNAGINCADNIDQNRKIVNDIYLHSWAMGMRELSPADSATLLQLALSDPVTSGDAVYSARVMLDTFPIIFTAARYAYEMPQPESENASITLYPQPATGKVTIDYLIRPGQQATLIVYALPGQEVLKIALDEGQHHQLDVSQLNNGLYLFAILINDEKKASGKMAIGNDR
jgi:hypothetical protein